VLEVVDKSLQYTREDRWPDARAMQRAIRDAYQAITGVSPTSVRLAFDETESVAHADTVVLSKQPTSLTAAHDSSDFPKKRATRQWPKVAWILTLCGVGIGGYSYFAQRNAAGVGSPFGEVDGGSIGVTAVELPNLPNPFASPDPSSQSAGPGPDPPGLSRVEAPPLDPDNADPAEIGSAQAEPPSPPAPSADDVPPPAPRPAPSAAPVRVATPPPPAPKPVTTATHKPSAPAPRPPAPVRKPPPPPPPPAPRPFRRP
jgi:hypothetical protein